MRTGVSVSKAISVKVCSSSIEWNIFSISISTFRTVTMLSYFNFTFFKFNFFLISLISCNAFLIFSFNRWLFSWFVFFGFFIDRWHFNLKWHWHYYNHIPNVRSQLIISIIGNVLLFIYYFSVVIVEVVLLTASFVVSLYFIWFTYLCNLRNIEVLIFENFFHSFVPILWFFCELWLWTENFSFC